MGPVAALVCVCVCVCVWCKEVLCARHRVVTLSGANSRGRLEAKTRGRFAAYPATHLDVSEITLAFSFTPSTRGTLLVVNRLGLLFRRLVVGKQEQFAYSASSCIG